MKSVSISFEYEENEYINADRKFLSLSGQLSRGKLITFAVLMAISVICLTMPSYASLGLFCVIIFALWFIKMAFRYYIKPKNDFGKKASTAKTYEFTFTKDKISLTTQRASADFQWKMFKKLYETNDIIYLAHNNNKTCTMIPKRAFESEDQLSAFRKIVGQGNSTMEYIRID